MVVVLNLCYHKAKSDMQTIDNPIEFDRIVNRRNIYRWMLIKV